MPPQKSKVVGRYGRPQKKKSFRLKFLFSRKFFYLALLTAILGGAFYFFLISGSFKMREVNISGFEAVSEEQILGAMNNILREKKFGLLGAANYFLLSEEKLQSSILVSLPKIKNADIKKIDKNVLEIYVEEREVTGVWCRDNECFYFDKEGVIFEQAPRSFGSLMVSVTDERDIEPNLGSAVLRGAQVDLVREAHRLLGNNFPFGVRGIIITQDVEFEILTSENWRVLLDKNEDIDYQLSNLKYVLDEEIGTRRGELEYVDLRLGNRVYYKYREN